MHIFLTIHLVFDFIFISKHVDKRRWRVLCRLDVTDTVTRYYKTLYALYPLHNLIHLLVFLRFHIFAKLHFLVDYYAILLIEELSAVRALGAIVEFKQRSQMVITWVTKDLSSVLEGMLSHGTLAWRVTAFLICSFLSIKKACAPAVGPLTALYDDGVS
jgi:hypothetical protein